MEISPPKGQKKATFSTIHGLNIIWEVSTKPMTEALHSVKLS